MKKRIQFFKIIIILSFAPYCLFGQFTTPSTGENGAGVATIYPRSTGNDIWESGSNIFRVSVYDDNNNNPSLAWRVSIGATNYNNSTPLAITSAVQAPDVALISDGTDMFAIVVYHAGGGSPRYVIETFKWHNPGSGLAFYSMAAPTGLWASAFHSAINVDATTNKDFAIVWDTPTPSVRIMTGNVSSGTFTFNNGGNSLQVSNSGESPDVSMFYASGAGNNLVYITYLTSNNTRLFVEYATFSVLAGGTYTPTATAVNNQGPSQTPNYTYGQPRIACPNSTGANSDWTVVVEETNGSRHYIVGYNDNSGATPITYNNSIANIVDIPNYFPVVTYDNDSPINIWVGWIIDDRGGNVASATDAVFPIGLLCDINASVVSTTYLEIANGITSTNDEATLLSLSGRYASCNVFSSYNAIIYGTSTVDELYTKSIACTATTFKIGNMERGGEINENSIYLFSVYDFSGRLLLKYEGELFGIINVTKNYWTV